MRPVVCCGLTTLDVTQVVERLPRSDEKVVARSLDVEVGGPAANAARTAAALGARTALVTALGRGPLAGVVLDGLAGIEVVDLADDDGAPPLSTVLVTAGTGERAVVSTNAVGRRTRLPEAGVLDDAGVLLVDGHLLPAQVELARAARLQGVPVLLDGGSWKPGLEELLAHVDLAVLSADFALPDDRSTPAGRLADVAALGPTFVARSAGPGPVEVLHDGVLSAVPVPRVDDVVDTLGAGDVLHGAMAAALADGTPWLTALERGVEVASESVRHPGAMGWARG